MQVVTDAMVKTPQPGDPSYEVFNKVGVPPTPHTYAVKWRSAFFQALWREGSPSLNLKSPPEKKKQLISPFFPSMIKPQERTLMVVFESTKGALWPFNHLHIS